MSVAFPCAAYVFTHAISLPCGQDSLSYPTTQDRNGNNVCGQPRRGDVVSTGSARSGVLVSGQDLKFMDAVLRLGCGNMIYITTAYINCVVSRSGNVIGIYNGIQTEADQ